MNGQRKNPGPIPPRWLNCPRKSSSLIGGKFLAFKTPLDSKYDDQVPAQYRFPSQMLFDSMRAYKVKIGLWIDLCNTSRWYNKRNIEQKECKYVKVDCKGHGEAPTQEQVNTFVGICRKFAQQNPLEIIAVHCTHGFNRTGFLISSYFIETEDWSPEAAVAHFADKRPPGIYKADYIKELFQRYGDVSDAPAVPDLPDWCNEDEADKGPNNSRNNGNQVDDDGLIIADSSGNSLSQNKRVKIGKFMEGVPGVVQVVSQPLLGDIQRRIHKMCDWHKGGFPGAQPVSMRLDNMKLLSNMPYKVSWKADGTRYMMLIDGKDRIFFADRDHCIYQVEHFTFLDRKDPNQHLTQTLLDGEMVIDEIKDANGHEQKFPRYLIYDIVKFKGQDVGLTDFERRLLCIKKEIIGARHTYIAEGKISKQEEPFSVRQKDFWDIAEAKTLLGPKFTKASLGHEPDGLVFQPAKEPYKTGRDDNILKWKPSSHNSIDFKLRISQESGMGMLPKTKGLLFVGGHDHPISEIRVTKELKQYNNKIIECKFDLNTNTWIFMRERTDKSFPNAYATAEAVMKSIREPVTEHILLDFIEHNRYGTHNDFRPPPPKMSRIH